MEEGLLSAPLRRAAALALAAGLCSGCVPSLQPLYTPETLVEEPALVGTWTDPEDEETWKVTRAGALGYRLLHTDRHGNVGEFELKALKLGSRLFADLRPVEAPTGRSVFYDDHLLYAHTFARIDAVKPNLRFASLDPEGLKKALAKEPGRLSHQLVDGDLVLTGSTAELQAFLSDPSKSDALFLKPAQLRRVK